MPRDMIGRVVGKSAYEIAVDNGYTGTIEDFTNDLNRFIPYTTIERNNLNPCIGYHVFDTTIGIPIWYNGTKWINAVGDVV